MDLVASAQRSWQGRVGMSCDRSFRTIAAVALRRDTLLVAGQVIALGGNDVALASRAVPAVEPECVTQLHWRKGSQPSVQLLIDGMEAEMMLDTGVSAPAITPALAKRLNLRMTGEAKSATGGGIVTSKLVDIIDARFASGGRLGSMQATVLDSSLLVDAPLPLDGMLGYNTFYPSDIDIDFPNATLRLWRTGDGSAVADAAGMRSVDARALPRFGILAVKVMAPDGSGMMKALGIIDTGSLFSIANSAAAGVLGLQTDLRSPKVGIQGVDGRAMFLPQARSMNVLLQGGTENPSIALHDVSFLVGDIPVLSTVIGKNVPTVLFGLDVLSRYRLLYSGLPEGTLQDGSPRLGVRLFISDGA